MGEHSKPRKEPNRAGRPLLAGALFIGALLVIIYALAPTLFGEAHPTPAPPDFAPPITSVAETSFSTELSLIGVDVAGEEDLALSTAHHICESSTRAATSPESMATVAAILSISADEATKFVSYTRLHCTDLP